MNDAKSMPFSYMVQVKNPRIPLSSQKAHVLAKLRKIRQPFFNFDYAKSAQFASPHGESREISTIHANF